MSERFNVILDTPPAERWRGIVDKTDFKQVLKFFRLLTLDHLTQEEKTAITLKIFFDNVPDDPELFTRILDYVACGESRDEDDKDAERVFDYNIDHGRIFAAFLQTYGIDLRTTEMHWWTFCELLNALPEETKLVQYVQLRGKKAGKNDSPEYKKELRKMQNAIRIDSEDSATALKNAMDSW